MLGNYTSYQRRVSPCERHRPARLPVSLNLWETSFPFSHLAALSRLVPPFLILLPHSDIARCNLKHQVNRLKGTKQHFCESAILYNKCDMLQVAIWRLRTKPLFNFQSLSLLLIVDCNFKDPPPSSFTHSHTYSHSSGDNLPCEKPP